MEKRSDNMRKLKQLYNKINSIPLYKTVMLEPIAEVVLIVPVIIFLLINPAGFITGKPWFSFGLNGVGFGLLQLGLFNENIIIVLLSFVPLLLKFLCVFWVCKKKKFFNLLLCGLYLLDFICGLVSLSNLHSTGVLLQEFSLYDKIGVILFCAFPLFLGVFLFWVYFNFEAAGKTKLLKKDKNNFKVCSSLVVLLIVFVVVFAYNCTDRNSATNEEIALLNNCYDYSEKYLYSALPEEKSELETMQKDIEAVLETDVFKRVVSKSKYEDRFLEAQKADEKGFHGATTEKSSYANELIFLKCKILLALDKNDEFISYYQENQHYFGFWADAFFDYLDSNLENLTEDDVVVIDKCMRAIMKSDTTEMNKFFAFGNLVKIHKDNENYEEKIKPELFELKDEYLSDFSSDTWNEYDRKLSNAKNNLYMLK